MADQHDQGELLAADPELDKILEAPVEDVPEACWAPTLARLVEVLFARYRRNGMRAEEAGKLANTTVVEIAHYFGGRGVYLPRGDRLRIALRDAEIFRRARRGNIPQLAEEFELTDVQVWRIVRQQRALHIAKIQGRLWEDNP